MSGVSAQNVALGLISGITRDPKGNLVFCDNSTNVIRRINADGTIQTIAGVGIPGYGGDGGAATGAILNGPGHPKYDGAGNLYFADTGNFRIRRIDTSGKITSVAGTGIQPSVGDIAPLGANGPAAQAQINFVSDLAVDIAGYVYFIDNVNQLRRITPSGGIEYYPSCGGCTYEFTSLAADAAGNVFVSDGRHIFRISSDGVIHNFAGFGSAPNMGNGGPALNAPPSDFVGLAADSAGNVYTAEENPAVVAADEQFIIRRIGSNGIINVIAGTFASGSTADGQALQTVLLPGYGFGLTADANGTVTFAEDYTVRQLTSQSTIQTIAGGQPLRAPDGTPALDAWFVGPNSIAFDHAGDLFIGEACSIRKIDSTDALSTVAGTGQCSQTAPSGPALTTALNGVSSIAVDSHDQVYFADPIGGIYQISSGSITQLANIVAGFSLKLAIDSQDRVYFSNPVNFGRIVPGSLPEYVQPGQFQSLYGYAVAIDKADDVYVCCDFENGENIVRYTPTLQPTVLKLPGIGASNPQAYGMALDPSSTLWQSEPYVALQDGAIPFGNGCLNGCYGSYGDGGPAESAYTSSWALAFAPSGDLYFLDAQAGRVRRIHGSPPTVPPAISSVGIVNAASLAGGARTWRIDFDLRLQLWTEWLGCRRAAEQRDSEGAE